MKTLQIMVLVNLLSVYPAFSQPTIEVRGSEQEIYTKRVAREILMHMDIQENMYLVIQYSDKLSSQFPGWTTFKAASETIPMPIIHVWIKSGLKPRKSTAVLAHEMIHVKQYIKGELVVTKDQTIFWHGKEYNYDGHEHQFTPWETEAHHWDSSLARIVRTKLSDPLLAQKVHQ